MKKQLSLLVGLTLVSTFLLANTYTVDTTFDVSADDGLMTLREAVDSANAHVGPDTILFSSDINGDTIKLTMYQIIITEPLTFDGNGMDSTVIDGQHMDRIFNVTTNASAVYLYDLTLQNGAHVTQGAGIFISNASLYIENCRIHRNNAFVTGRTNVSVYGGGIYCSSSNLTIIQSVIENNSAVSANSNSGGGGIYAMSNSNVSISNSTIRFNEINGEFYSSGGGLCLEDNSNLDMIASTINGNVVRDGSNNPILGGGIYLSQGGTHHIKSSTISGNGCIANNAEGGGIYISSTTLDLISSTLTLNYVSGISSDYGGAAAGSATLNLVNTVIWGNFQNGTSEVNDVSDADHSLVRGYDLTPLDPNSFDGSEAHNPLFGPLADNGGPNQTHALCYGSAAYNAGNPDSTHADQRGLPVFDTMDIGAFEAQSALDTVSIKKIFVDSSNNSGTENGTSWASAYTNFQDAIDAACEKDTIWVAKGTYFPTKDRSGVANNRFNTFFIDKNVVILGGFEGDETSSDDRDWVMYPTVLSGDIGNSGDISDNTYHVVWTQDLDSCTLIDGFLVIDGNADASFPYDYGGGWFNNGSGSGNKSNPTLNNCAFSRNTANFGGGMSNLGFNAAEISPTLNNCTFSGNNANNLGGGISNWGATAAEVSPTLNNCTFSGNNAYWGGGMSDYGSSTAEVSPTLNNCTFSGNNADHLGGGMFNQGSGGEVNPTLNNCTFSGNNANHLGGGMFNWGSLFGISNPTLNNCILFGNSSGVHNNSAFPVYSYSLVQGQLSDTSGNIPGNIDPLFVDMPDTLYAPTTQGNLRLRPCSPVINAGENSSIPVGLTYDLDGGIRIQKDTVDLGAYETPWAKGDSSKRFYVDSSNISGIKNGYSWATAYTDLQDAIDAACEKDTIWVAEGTYFPTKDTSGIPNDRFNTFFIDKNIVILGGFAGGETSDDRDWEIYPTVLSGDIGDPGDSTDNTYHVVRTQYLDSCALISGFTITEGNADYFFEYSQGGGWFNNGSGTGKQSNPSLTDCTFSKNYAVAGGGMFNLGAQNGESNPTLTNCTFSMNTARRGGGLYNLGEFGQSNPTLTNCTFSKNYAVAGGGGMVNFGDIGQSSPTLRDCIFSENSTNDYGGGMYNIGDNAGESNPTLTNCAFLMNTASHGGGMYNIGFDDGETNPFIVNSMFSGNSASLDGGGIQSRGDLSGVSNPILTNCTFSGNYAFRNGGGMYNLGVQNGKSSPSLFNCTFSGNYTNDNGGGLYNSTSPSGESNPIISNTIVFGNSNGVFNTGNATPVYSNSLVQGQLSDTSGNIPGNIDPLFVDMPDTLSAPTTNGNLHLRPCSPAINAGENDSIPVGIIYDLDGGMRIQRDTVDMGAYETPWVKGGGNVVIYVDSSNTETPNNGGSWETAFSDFQDALCLGCEKDTIWVAKGTYYPTDSLNKYIPTNPRTASFYIESNLVILGGFEGDETTADDRDWEVNPTILSGDIGTKGDSTDNTYHVIWTQYLDSCTLVDGFWIIEGNADGSVSHTRGGGWYNDGSNGNHSNPTINNCTFSGNSAKFDGGGMYNFAEFGEANPTLTNCTFSGNNAGNWGGGMTNNADNGESNPFLNNCTFSGNHAGALGGGMINYADNGESNPFLNNCTFSENSASRGGAMYNFGYRNGEANPTLNHCTFIGNSANSQGGAMENFGQDNGESNPSLNHCTFIGNSALNGGGMINYVLIDGEGSPILTNCIFSGNNAIIDGGGMYNYAEIGEANPTLINCTFSGNNAVNGGGMYNYLPLEGFGELDPIFSNTIVFGNSSGILNFNATPVYTNCLVQEQPSDSSGNIPGDIDPLFTDMPDYNLAPTTSGDLRLTSCSPVIDAGSNILIPSGITTDLDGNARIVGDSVDMGAYEYDGPAPVLSCNDITLNFSGGSGILSGLDSAAVLAGSDPCFDSVFFSQKVFDCADLPNTPVQIAVFGTSSKGSYSQCNASIDLVEDPEYCCTYGQNSDLNHIKSIRLESSEDTLMNESNNDNGYGDYTSLVTEVNAGAKLDVTLMSFTINPITYKYWHVWIDFNGNGSFTSNELVYQAEGSQSIRNFKVTIPTGLPSGNRAMRIAMQLNPGFPDPCAGFPLGEVEDYTLYIESCPEVLVLVDQSLGGVYTASKEIRTKGEVIVGSETEFRAEEFFLGKEFRVVDGVLFQTVKDPCGVVIPPIGK